jgi:hypothetical protein
MRSVGLVLWIAALAAVLLPLFRRPLDPAAPARTVVRDELVRDPVCQTYVVRSRAVVRGRPGDPVYFCSAECAQRYAGPVGV